MSALTSAAFVLLLACDVRLLAGSRLRALIQTVALQGVLLASLPMLLPHGDIGLAHVRLLAFGVAIIKGWVVPRMLHHALRTTAAHRELQPLVGYNVSLLAAGLMLALSIWLGGLLAAHGPSVSRLLATVAFFTLFSGLFLVLARRQALTQVVGYLVFENGIYAFGMTVLREQPLLVEMGVLFDLVVAVLVMSLIVFELEHDLGHSDSSRLHVLRG